MTPPRTHFEQPVRDECEDTEHEHHGQDDPHSFHYSSFRCSGSWQATQQQVCDAASTRPSGHALIRIAANYRPFTLASRRPILAPRQCLSNATGTSRQLRQARERVWVVLIIQELMVA
jgi:hypothetical protein